MSFLVEDDAHETLQVALAFIDACDDSLVASSDSDSSSSPLSLSSSRGSPVTTTTSSDSDSRASGSPLPITGSEPLQQPTRNAERPKGNVEAVRRLRAKKKVEAVQLREQVAQLEAQLLQLQRAHKTGGSLQVYLQRLRAKDGDRRLTGDENTEGDDENELLVAMAQPAGCSASSWLKIAAAQAQKRLKSQVLNAELKDAVSRQVKLVESIEAMLANKANQFGLDLLRDEQKQFLQRNAALAQEAGILTELRYRVQQMHLRLNSIFDQPFWVEIADSTVCSIRLTQNRVSGPIVELRMNVPLSCDFRDAGEAIWRRTISINPVIQTPTYSMQRQQLTQTSFQKCFTMTYDGAPNGKTVELRGTAYAQRFLVGDRFAYLWVSAVMSNYSETYREQGWAVAADATDGTTLSDSEAQTLYRVYFQVACDSHEAAPSPEAKARREFVLKTLGNRTRMYHQFTQNLLLDEFSGFQTRQPLLLPGSESC